MPRCIKTKKSNAERGRGKIKKKKEVVEVIIETEPEKNLS